MDQNYYPEYFRLEREHWWFVVRGNIIMDRLSTTIQSEENLKILNIGIATGRTTELLSRFGTVTSVEYDATCCDFVRKQTGIEVIQASILDLPFEDNSFDIVCAFDVIEHVEDDHKAAMEMNRVCKPNGHVAVTVPAFMSLWSHHDEVNFHYRRYVMNGLLSLFKPTSLKTCYKTYFNSFLFPPIWLFRVLSKWLPQKKLRKGAGSDFTLVGEKSLINKIMLSVFNLERRCLRKVTFPIGVSIMLLLQKK